MGRWSDSFRKVDERAAISFKDWDELNCWFDSFNSYRGCCCPFIEELYVIGCYQIYRKHELNEVVAGMYTEFSHTYKDFTILEEIEPWDNDYDIESLPMWVCKVDGEDVALFPEEIFVNY